MNQDQGTHTFAEHTGELLLRLEASSLHALFLEAGRALADVMTGGHPPEPAVPLSHHEVSLHAADRDALLIDWLNELIFLTDKEKQVFTHFQIEHLTETILLATVAGGEVEHLVTQVKAATLHGVRIEQTVGRYTVDVLLDV